MAVNKVEFGGDTLIDLTSDTVTPETLAEGETAHNAAGEEITGTLKVQDEIVTTTGTATAYEATVRGITELKAGVSFIMIPHQGGSATADRSLNVNSLGAKPIYRRCGYNSLVNAQIRAGFPHRVMYDGSRWILVDFPRPNAYDIMGIVPVENGGVPSTNADNAGKVLTTNASGIPEWQEPSGGSSTPSVSLIGTWTVIDNPEIPTSDIPLEFTSNGTEYIGIGSTSMGSSSWGINALSYISPEGYYDAAYVNNPSESYGITHGWRNETYRYLTVTKEPDDSKAIAWLGANTDAPKVELPKEEMPQIRFVSLQDTNGRMALNEANPFTFTVEVTGGGALKEGDLLQICVRRKSWHKRKDSEVRKGKWKLRQVAQKEITSADIEKRFLSIKVTADDVSMHGNFLFHNDRNASRANGTIDTLSYIYFRIKRVTKYDSDGVECNAIFSNVERVAKTYNESSKEVSIK